MTAPANTNIRRTAVNHCAVVMGRRPSLAQMYEVTNTRHIGLWLQVGREKRSSAEPLTGVVAVQVVGGEAQLGVDPAAVGVAQLLVAQGAEVLGETHRGHGPPLRGALGDALQADAQVVDE